MTNEYSSVLIEVSDTIGAKTNGDSTMTWYDQHADKLAEQYESVGFEQVHQRWIHLLPEPGTALDVGAGSGRDAAWLTDKGWQVVAVEPSPAMQAEGRAAHPAASIYWINDQLPTLARVKQLYQGYRLILLAGVFMHLPTTDQEPALDTLIELLGPGGLLVISLRKGPCETERGNHPTDADALATRATAAGLTLELDETDPDSLGRRKVSWRSLVFSRPE